MKSSYVQSTKKNKMLVLGDRVFHVNKTVPTNHLGKPNCTKVYWRCITKNCGGSAYTVSTEEGEEIEVRLSRDHDPVLCAEDKHIPLTIERRREVKNLARAVLCLYRYFLNISCQVIDKVAEGTPLEVAYNEGEYSSSSRSFILIKRCTVYIAANSLMMESTGDSLEFSARSLLSACARAAKKATANQTTAPRVIAVKLGGSAITNKGQFESLKEAKLRITCSQIKQIYEEQKTNAEHSQFILVHGAGSFGHFQAREFGLKNGGSDESWHRGVCSTRLSLLKLNGIISQHLADKALPVVTASPFSHMTTNNHKIVKNTLIDQIASLLTAGFLPLSHGDVVLDKSRRCGVLSGDKVLELLAAKGGRAKPEVVVFLTDVSGVYNRNPSDPSAVLLPLIIVQSDGSVS